MHTISSFHSNWVLSCAKRPSCHSLTLSLASRAPPPHFDEKEREKKAEISFLEAHRSTLAMDVGLVRQIEHASLRATTNQTNDMVVDNLTRAIKETSSLRDLETLLLPPAMSTDRGPMGGGRGRGRGRGQQLQASETNRAPALSMLQTSAATVRLAKLLLEHPSVSPPEVAIARRLLHDLLLPAINKQLWDMDARGMCNTIWAMSKIGSVRSTVNLWTIDPVLVRKLLEVAVERARSGQARGQNSSSLLYALAILDEIYSRSRLEGASSRGQQQRLFQSSTLQSLIDLTCDSNYLYLCGPQSVANSIWALARLGLQPSRRGDEEPWLEAALHHATPLLHGMDPRQLTTLTFSLVKMKAAPDAQLAKILLSSTMRKLGLFSFRDLAEISWSLANLGIRPAERDARAICREASSPRVAIAGDPSGVSGLMYALSRWQIRPPEEFLTCLCENWMSPSELGKYNALQITDVLRSLANLGISSPSDAWSVALLDRLGRLLAPEEYSDGSRGARELSSLNSGTRISLRRALKTLGLSRRAECYTISAKLGSTSSPSR